METMTKFLLSLAKTRWTTYSTAAERIEVLKNARQLIKSRLAEAESWLLIEDPWIKHCLHQLRSLYFDIDGLLDMHETDRLISLATSSRKRKRYRIGSMSPNWSLIGMVESEIHRFNTMWVDIEKKIEEVRHGDNARTGQPVPLPFIEHLGREDEKNEIAELLVSDLSQGSNMMSTVSDVSSFRKKLIPVVPIFGAAGIGKTTLARMVYEDQRIDSFFCFKVWVRSSGFEDVVREMYKAMTGEDGSQDFKVLQHELKDHLKRRHETHGNKFFLVIDDLRAENFEFGNSLQALLHEGEKGSKVLITTCDRYTCKAMGALERPILTGLNDEECWQLIQSIALPQGTNDQTLLSIGRKIAERCQGSPLAAKTFGYLLCGGSEEDWSYRLNTMRALKDDRHGVLARLMVCYNFLTYDEKQCFSYCCIYPIGHEFEREQLIRYWMAEGLIQPDPIGSRQPEELGRVYFENMLEKSFFETVTSEDQVVRYRIPTLMCDLAKTVAGQNYVDLSDDGPRLHNMDEPRYASMLHPKGTEHVNIDRIEHYKKLRAFCLLAGCLNDAVQLHPISPQFFCKFKNLHVLDLSGSDLKDIPNSVGDLILLRYLGLAYTNVTTIPESVCRLYNLQTLELKGCTDLALFPEHISKLVNLRHLGLHIDWDKITDRNSLYMPRGISRLTSLQTLSRFTVASNAERNSNIRELKNLDVRGDICILNLENITNHHDAREACLRTKQNVASLMLRWSDEVIMDCSQLAQVHTVADSLRPNNTLRCLWFVNYPSPIFPGWLGDPTFTNLETIRISNVEFVPRLGSLRRLKDLHIEKVKVRTLFSFVGYPSLKNLTIREMPIMEAFLQENIIPSLQKIEVSDCPELRKVVIHQNLHSCISWPLSGCPGLIITSP